MELIDELRKRFGFSSFRPGQEEIIQALLQEQNVLAVLPTGNGKSLCYQLTGYLREGLVVIVSPLQSEKAYVLQHLAEYKFLFLSPEMLTQKELLNVLQRQKIGLYVIDEAHCVSQWGVDFRPEYQQLGVIGKRLGSPVTLALTATATTVVQQDIEKVLFDLPPQVVRHSVNRKNLFVRKTEDKDEELATLMKQANGSMIIYCATKKEVERLYQLYRGSFSVGYYHGGLDASQRRQLQLQFSQNKLQFLVATNAFGMGIDKPDIRAVVHYDLPDSLENYVQEIGRAGRDQQPSKAILLYKKNDERIHYFFNQLSREQRQVFEFYLENDLDNNEFFDEVQQKWLEVVEKMTDPQQWVDRLKAQEKAKQYRLQQMLHYINSETCRRELILDYFGEKLVDKPIQCCDKDGAELYGEAKTITPPIVQKSSWQEILLNLFKKNNG